MPASTCRQRIITTLHTPWSRDRPPLAQLLREKRHHLFGIERPVQLGAVVTTAQHRNDQAIAFEQSFVLGNVDQFNVGAGLRFMLQE